MKFSGHIAPASFVFLCLMNTAFSNANSRIKFTSFEEASQILGISGYTKEGTIISASEQQEAMLTMMKISGCFEPKNLWDAINKMGKFEDPNKVFKAIYSQMKKSGAFEKELTKFNPELLRNSFGKNETIKTLDMLDLTLYLSQSLFGRKVGVERYEIASSDYNREQKDAFLKSAKIMRLLDCEAPSLKEYDMVAIAGASRPGLIYRIAEYLNLKSEYNLKIKDNNLIVLAGNPELWAEIVGIFPDLRDELLGLHNAKNTTDIEDTPSRDLQIKTNEGREYIISLAQKNNIKLVQNAPFKVGMNGRTYANYENESQPKLTETLMSQDLLEQFGISTSMIIDTQSGQGSRPTTPTTGRDVAEFFINLIAANKFDSQEKFHILLVTNNPYILRHRIALQNEFDKILKEKKLDYQIIIEGVGPKFAEGDIKIIRTEFAALISELYKSALSEAHGKRDIKDLLYQTRDNSEENIPPIPDVLLELSDTSELLLLGESPFYHFGSNEM